MTALRRYLQQRRLRKLKLEITSKAAEMRAEGLIPESWWR